MKKLCLIFALSSGLCVPAAQAGCIESLCTIVISGTIGYAANRIPGSPFWGANLLGVFATGCCWAMVGDAFGRSSSSDDSQAAFAVISYIAGMYGAYLARWQESKAQVAAGLKPNEKFGDEEIADNASPSTQIIVNN